MSFERFWKWVKLGEATKCLDNLRKPINSSDRQRRIAGKSEKKLYPYYGATGQVGWIDSFITNGEYVLVGEDGAPFLDIYKAKAYKIKGKTWVNNHAHILQEVENISINDFILHYLNSINYRQYVNGTTRLKLTKGSLVEIPFPLPSIGTQQAIVSKIEELFSELDKGIENLRLAQQQLKTYRQSVLKWAFEGKLTGHVRTPVLIRSARPEISMAAEPEFEYGGETGLPEGWKWSKIGDLMESVRNGYSKKPDEQGKYKILRISSVRPNKVFIDDVRYLESEIGIENSLTENDILFTRYNGSIDFVGVCGRVPKLKEKLYYPDKLIRCRPKIKEWFHSAYIDYAANSRLARQFVLSKIKTTAGQTGISGSDVKEIPIPLAPLEKQYQVVMAIESRLSVADKMEEGIIQSLQQAEALRQSILKRAFEGKLI